MINKLFTLTLIGFTMCHSPKSENPSETNNSQDTNQNVKNVIDNAVNTPIKCKIEGKKSQLSMLNLKGKIQHVIVDVYQAVKENGEIKKRNLSTKDLDVFDDNGNHVYSINYDPMYESEGVKYISKYDQACSKKEALGYDEKNKYIGKTTYKYNENNFLVEQSSVDKEGNLSSRKVIYKYDKNGNNTEREYYSDENGLVEKSTYEYNSNNDVIVCKWFDKDGIPTGQIWTYQYAPLDSLGNYVNKITFFKGKLQSITFREIKYW